ncbi:MAG: thiamine phosphate synthase [Myxococcales bacterium]|nr:thiamine phosphate synthase [Myxococcales bacterium]
MGRDAREQFFYAMLDAAALDSAALLSLTMALLDRGIRWFQLRAKGLSTREAVELAQELRRRIPRGGGRHLLINDRVDVALLAEACGVHLGQTDLPYREARRLLGKTALIGLSTHNLTQATEAEAAGADYIGFGPIFATATKRDTWPTCGVEALRQVVSRVACPVVAIGGIAPHNATAVWETGVDAVASIGAVSHSATPTAVVEQLLSLRRRSDTLDAAEATIG